MRLFFSVPLSDQNGVLAGVVLTTEEAVMEESGI